jgi:hypothetical protein
MATLYKPSGGAGTHPASLLASVATAGDATATTKIKYDLSANKRQQCMTNPHPYPLPRYGTNAAIKKIKINPVYR